MKFSQMKVVSTIMVALVVMMFATFTQAQDTAATAISVRGVVTVTDSNGDSRRLRRGDAINSGDSIETANRARVRMSFTDGSTMVLQANTKFEVTEYSFSGSADGTEKATFKIFEGALEAISGLIGKKNNNAFRLDTPLATIGLRGTTYSVTVYPATGNGQPRVVVSTHDGAVLFASSAVPNGILVNAGNSVSQSGNSPPQQSNSILIPLAVINVEGDGTEPEPEPTPDPNASPTPAPEPVADDGATVRPEDIDNIITALAGQLTQDQLIILAAELLDNAGQAAGNANDPDVVQAGADTFTAIINNTTGGDPAAIFLQLQGDTPNADVPTVTLP